jgi:hypothetical protein
MIRRTTIKDVKGEGFEVIDWIVNMAKEYGWTSGILDEDMANAIEKARNDPDDPWGLGQSLAKSRLSYEAMRFCQGTRSAEEIFKDTAYAGEELLAVVKPTMAEKEGAVAIKKELEKLENSCLKMMKQATKLKALYLYSDEISDEEKKKALSILNWLSDEPPSEPLSEEEKNKLFSEINADFLKDDEDTQI